MLASISSFLGTAWFVALVGLVCFIGGVYMCPKIRSMFKMGCPHKDK